MAGFSSNVLYHSVYFFSGVCVSYLNKKNLKSTRWIRFEDDS